MTVSVCTTSFAIPDEREMAVGVFILVKGSDMLLDRILGL